MNQGVYKRVYTRTRGPYWNNQRHGAAVSGGAVHAVTTRRAYKGRVYETHLLRRSCREGDRVKNETLGNLSHLPAPLIDLVRRKSIHVPVTHGIHRATPGATSV